MMDAFNGYIPSTEPRPGPGWVTSRTGPGTAVWRDMSAQSQVPKTSMYGSQAFQSGLPHQPGSGYTTPTLEEMLRRMRMLQQQRSQIQPMQNPPTGTAQNPYLGMNWGQAQNKYLQNPQPYTGPSRAQLEQQYGIAPNPTFNPQPGPGHNRPYGMSSFGPENAKSAYTPNSMYFGQAGQQYNKPSLTGGSYDYSFDQPYRMSEGL